MSSHFLTGEKKNAVRRECCRYDASVYCKVLLPLITRNKAEWGARGEGWCGGTGNVETLQRQERWWWAWDRFLTSAVSETTWDLELCVCVCCDVMLYVCVCVMGTLSLEMIRWQRQWKVWGSPQGCCHRDQAVASQPCTRAASLSSHKGVHRQFQHRAWAWGLGDIWCDFSCVFLFLSFWPRNHELPP